MTRKADKTRKNRALSAFDALSHSMTTSIGTPMSILVHTVLFIGIFGLIPLGFSLDSVLLILTTAVSLEAIYLAIFIQMSVNRQAAIVEEVSEDIEDIQEDVQEVSEDIQEVSEDIEDIQEDVEDVTEDIEDIQEDVEGLESDVDELSHEVTEDDATDKRLANALTRIESDLKELHREITILKERNGGQPEK